MSDPPGLDLARLATYLSADHLSGSLIAGGRSNLTYRVTDGRSRWVVRRPPLGHVLPTAHDMAREYRVISALQGSPVPVPRVVLYCADESVLGAPFYVMDEVPGVVLRSAEDFDALPDGGAVHCGRQLVDVLLSLHRIPPAAVGLGDFGRPEGYLARQVARWYRQWERSATRELPALEALHQRLAATVPQSARAAILHGDYRLDNVLFDPTLARIDAVLDWEMSTLGDPLADVGLLYTYTSLAADGLRPGGAALPGIGRLPAGRPADGVVRRGQRDEPGEARLVRRVRPLQAGHHQRGHPCPLPGRPDRGRRLPVNWRAGAESGGPRLGTPGGGVMDFGFSPRATELCRTVEQFLDECVYPAEPVFEEQVAGAPDRWDAPPVLASLKQEARARGLWNLFLPDKRWGAGLSNVEYAPIAELSGRSPHLAPEAMNCSAPDTGNMELLAMFGTPEQQERWLVPLLDGEIRSCFSMTEPDVASSDATNIATRIVRDGDEYVINGRKWWSSGAMNPRCRVAHRDGRDRPRRPDGTGGTA